MKLYRQFESQEQIDAQYNLRALYPNLQATLDRYAQASLAARRTLDCRLDVRYGPTLDETLDIFPSTTPGSPVLVFIHGGYWRALSSKEFSFIARGLVEHGVTVAVTNYSLCPKVSIEEITRQNRAALAWLHANAHQFNGDRQRLFVMGNSAGGHQTAMMLCTDWKTDYGLPADLIKGGIAVSGIYDLAPLRYSFLQPVVLLDHDLIQRQSPLLNIPERAPPLLVSVGEGETEEFRRQSKEFTEAWQAAGLSGRFELRPGVDHFTIIDELADPRSRFSTDIVRFMQDCALERLNRNSTDPDRRPAAAGTPTERR